MRATTGPNVGPWATLSSGGRAGALVIAIVLVLTVLASARPPVPLAAPDRTAAVTAFVGPPAPGPVGPLYAITVVPHGLPSAIVWGVSVDHTSPSTARGTTNITESLANGSYEFYFVVLGVNSYAPAPASANVTVRGAPESLTESFVWVYTLTFSETGLPIANQSKWHLFVDYIEKSALAGQPIQYVEPNGSYQVSAGATLPYLAVPATTTIVVNGPPSGFVFSFFPPPTAYNVTFRAAGLPASTVWAITVDGRGGGQLEADGSVLFREPNGTHVYSVGEPAGWIAAPAAATFGVAGVNVSIQVVFQRPATYPVAFLPTGIGPLPWSLSIPGVGSGSSPNGGAVSWALPNGSYSYSVAPLVGLQPFPPTGTFWVAGGAVNVPIAFYATQSTVTFTELGLPSGTWWVNVNSTNHTAGAGAEVLLQLPVGSYAFTAGVSNSSYLASIGRGNLVVGSQAQVITVTFLSLPSPPGSAGGSTSITSELKAHLPEVALGAAAVVAVLAFLVWRRYRLPPPPTSRPSARVEDSP